MKMFKTFYWLCIFYLFTIHILPFFLLGFFIDEKLSLKSNEFLFPLCFILGVFLIGYTLSKVKIKSYRLKGFSSKTNIIIFIIWVFVSCILHFTGNLTMASVAKVSIPFITQLKAFNSFGIIFTYYYSIRFMKKEISYSKFILIILIILLFNFLTLSKFLIFINLIVVFLICVKSKKLKLIFLTLGGVFFLNIYNFLLDYRSSISSNVDIEVLQDNRLNNIVDNPVLEFFLDRLNYYKILSSIEKQNFYLKESPYSLLSIVPRFIYPNKPNIGIDTNAFGRKIGILDKKDFRTSLGIGVVGEAYAFYRYAGLFSLFFYFVIFFMFRLVSTIPFRIIMLMSFITIDTFAYILPMFIQIFIFSFLFSGFQINNHKLKLSNEKY